MPPTTRGRKKDIIAYVAVTFAAGAPKLMYGFKTFDLGDAAGVTTNDLTTQLGHLYGTNGVFTFPAGTIPVFGANSPKPPRVSRPTGATVGLRSISTFCAGDKVVAARNAGWALSKQGRGITVRGTAGNASSQVTAWVEIAGGGRYAYRMNKEDFTAYKAILGCKTVGDGEATLTDAERATIFFGASAPKPGKAALLVAAGEGTASFSSFYADSQASALVSAGWALTQGIPGMTAAPASPPATP